MTNYAAPTPPFIAARWHGGAQTPRLIVMHSTVGPTKAGSAKGVAQFFARLPDTDKASAHYVVDEAEIYQCVGDHTVAYHCGYNQDSIGIEMCDNPALNGQPAPITRWDDAQHIRLEIRTAHLVAELCLAYNIRPYYVPAWALKLGAKGVTTHAQMSQAFHASDHWDPGAWRRYRFMKRVRRQIGRIKSGVST